MDESLLVGGVPEEEDELLWNELKDDNTQHDTHHHSDFGDHLRHPHGPHGMSFAGNAAAAANTGGGPMPSLRAHVHLPAISNLFRNVVESARGSYAAGRQGSGQQDQHHQTPPSTWQPRISHAPDEFGRVANLDAFLISLYNYFYHKGFWSIAVVELVALVTGLFSVTLSSFLMGCVQWRKIIACNHNHDPLKKCGADLEEFVTCRADDNSIATVLTSFYFVMFLGYWLFRALQLVGTLRDAHDMAAFYRGRYAISWTNAHCAVQLTLLTLCVCFAYATGQTAYR